MPAAHIVTGARPSPRLPLHSVVTVGVFDGVHVAHQQLVRTTVRLARRRKVASGVITFDPDPQHVLHPDRAQPALMPLSERLASLAALGVGWIWVMPFTKRFARMAAARFVQRVLLHQLRAAAVVVGDGFLFGRDRAGDLRMLRRLGAPYGMGVVAIHPIRRDGKPVSSSRIRRLITRGALVGARQLLARPPALYGTVVRGAGRGRRLGFPTANIRLMPQALPPQGVYAVTLLRTDTGRRFAGVMNFGVRPTFGGGPLVCEVHVFGFRGRLLGQFVAVSLLQRLRSERRFTSPDALRAQVRQDVARARRLFARRS